jgi:sec-independent protein translocase protein TatA
MPVVIALIDPWEAIMIGAVVIILVIWGPQKIPELAKSLGQARHELERASKENNDDRKTKSSQDPSTP